MKVRFPRRHSVVAVGRSDRDARAIAAVSQARAVERRLELSHTAGWSVAVATQGDTIPDVWSALTTRGALVG